MKRTLCILMTALLLALAACAAAEPAFTVTPNPPKGINYSYLKRLKALGWKSDTAAVSLPA